MERSLADILREERQIGHKGDGGWKVVAYNTVAVILSTQFDIESGFNWDATKKMISVDEDNVWDEYVKSHEGAKTFRFKVIANWDDIMDLCGKDRATGEGAETCAEAAEVMTPESDPNNIVDLESDTQDLSPDEQLKACSWFIENEKQFLMLKTFPTERKKGMVFMFISPKA
ncbi:hypothetical protein L3X38_033341 [Prunus dulcis]|uniref:Myb/SANT-like domain-containing protein n=1 Tax=Prunus dulcis TaxID=3755 RepID=A0AAD4VGW9_PRUDU|nr:hypothetical protein L3X38_033341 [Prunus dulcis]